MGPEKGSISICGAGPAGLAAAITLAKGGRRVIVHRGGIENSLDMELKKQALDAGVEIHFGESCRPAGQRRMCQKRDVIVLGAVAGALRKGYVIVNEIALNINDGYGQG